MAIVNKTHTCINSTMVYMSQDDEVHLYTITPVWTVKSSIPYPLF